MTLLLFVFHSILRQVFYQLILLSFSIQNGIKRHYLYKKRAAGCFFTISGSFLHLHFITIICDTLLKVTFNDQRIISPFGSKLVVLPGVLICLHRLKDNLSQFIFRGGIAAQQVFRFR